jgi:hypothetical protein
VKGIAGKWSGHNPFVMSLVKVLVNARVVQPAMDPVNAKVAEQDEERELENIPPCARPFLSGVVEFAVAPDLSQEDGSCEDGHDRH